LRAASHSAGRYESTARNQYEKIPAKNTPRSPQKERTRDTIPNKNRFHKNKNLTPGEEPGAGMAG
jgi:hypothetical protein